MGEREIARLRAVPELLIENATRQGVAFADDHRAVSWAELAHRTARLAAGLAVDRGARVAFLLDNRVELVEGLLATVRAAAVGVPLSPRGTDAELAALLADCAPAVLVTDRQHLPRATRVTAGQIRLAVVDDLAADGEPRDDLGLDEPAWLLYTSGTTGTPRAAVFSQRSALWSPVACYVPLLGLSSADRLLWPLPLAHTYAHSLCVLGTTVAGASARITSTADPTELARLIEEYRPTVLAGVPLTYQQLLDTGLGTVPSLRLCVTAGAPSDPDLRERVAARLGAPLLDGYGSTETCGKIAMETVEGPRVRGSSGLPVPGMEVRLVNPETGRDANEGEIWVRGPGVMLGYHNQPRVTDWYHTGDLGKRGEHGCLTVTGRVDDRIVRGGENVDPVEVEQVLRGLPGVHDAAVVARAHPLLGEVPVAFVVPTEEGLDPAALLRACAEVLSTHKVPEEILFTPAIPRTAAGKPRRAVLREALAERPAEPEFAQLASGERRAALVDLVCKETAAISGASANPDTAFADLGLSSMGAMALWHRLSLRTGLNLPATLVWDRPNPTAVAAYLNTRLHSNTSTTVHPPNPHESPIGAPGGPPESTLPATTDNSGALNGNRQPIHPPNVHERDSRAPGGPLISTLPASTDNSRRRGSGAEPVAIVAAACRYPGGVRSPEDLWQLVVDGVDATSEFPTDRGWDLDALFDPDPDRLGATYSRRGGFLHDAAEFDPLFFGISPREALATDPQQRLLLEVAWEALERAGIPAPSLRGSDTGVFVGLMHAGYGAGVSPHELESHLATGSAGSVASGRISYVLGLRGPTLTVDTACSSSLVAMDLAATALRAGECTLALAGGVTVMSSPQPFIAFSRQRGLSADGRCRSFAQGADGTAWGEGVGLVLLEKLSDAQRNGHPVLAVLRGSAVNSDGASNGLTAPNGAAQRELIQLALADAGLQPSDVDVIEGHGTGTALGDPIEANALLATYGQNRTDPAWLGSVKSNLGHTQAAAGVAGVLKMIEAMRHDVLPRSLYAEDPSSHVDWSAGAVRLLDQPQPWPARERPRRAAISSFGIGGTNAHVIIEEPPATGKPPARRPWPAPPWLVSGSDEAGLRAHANRLATALANVTNESTMDIAYSLATTRTPLPRRAAVFGTDAASLLAGLRAATGATARNNPAVALLCAGQGAQRAGMGRTLATAFPVFDAAFTELCEEFTPWLDRPLLAAIDDPDLVDRTDYAQPALFAFAVAMHTLLADCGVRPGYLVGHSVGELAAAHVAGVFSRADAVRLVAARGRLMAALPAGGAMIAVRAPLAEVSPLLDERVAVSAVNGPNSVVLSGDEDAVTELAARLGRPATRLRVSHAFHSPLLDPMLAEFRAIAESVTYHRPTVPIVSTVVGRPEPDALTSADYWVRQARDTVRFADAVRWLADAGVTAFVEAGPGSGLSALAEENVPDDAMCVPCPDADGVLAALAALHVHGVRMDWRSVYAGSGAQRFPLPTYPFQRQRYWLAATRRHPLLGDPRPDADGSAVRHTGVLSTDRQPWLADHVIGDRVLVPATVFAELAFQATGRASLAELVFHEPLVLSEPAHVQVVVDEGAVTIWARTAEGPWTRHATATTGAPIAPVAAAWPPADAEELPVDYARLAARGHHYGPAFRAVTALWRRGTDVFAELALPPGENAGAYTLHPALLDAALHAALLAEGPGEPRVPLACTGVTVHATGATAARAHLARLGPDEIRVTLTDAAGRPLATVDSLVTRPMPAAARVYRLTWRPGTPSGTDTTHELLDVAGLDVPEDMPGRVRGLVTATLARVREWVTDDRPGRLVVLTRNATGEDPDPAEAAVAGFVRSAQSEHPGRIALVDGPMSALETALSIDEPQVAIHDGIAMVPRLTPAEPSGTAPALDGTVLITGGTGALGASLARYLVAEHGVRHLLLVNRSGRTPAWAADLPATVVACDMGDRAAVEAVVASCGPALTAVFHLAGVVADGVVDGMTPERVATVLAPKADGAWHLHEATKGLGLKAFVLYSSAAGVLGRPGQSNYAAANGFLDALARHRVANGLPAQALAWGPWSTVDDPGMAGRVGARQLGDGVRAVTEREGVALLDAALRSPEPMLAPVPLNLDALAGSPILADLRATTASGPPNSSVPTTPDNSPPSTGTREPIHPPNVHESPIGAPGGPPESTLPGTTDNPAHPNGNRQDLHPPNQHESPFRAPGGPPDSTLPETTDNSAAPNGNRQPIHPPNRHQWDSRAPGGPLISTLPASTDNSAASNGNREAVHPPNVHERDSRAPGGPPMSTLPAGTDNSGPAVEQPGAWRDRLAAVPARERDAMLSGLIRAELAAVLGFPDAAAFPTDRAFSELGFDSLTGLQVRNRLSAFTRVRLPATLLLDHPTLPTLTAHIHAALRDTLPDGPEPDYGFSTVYHRVLREKGPFEAMALRHFASYALPSFTVADRARHVVAPVQLARGRGTALAYLPDYLTPYQRVPVGLAAQFDGERDLFLLEHPGFGDRRAVPDSVATLVRTHAETVRALGRPVVLVGFCAGGAVAHAVARHLARTGAPPQGLVLLDSHDGVLRRDDPRALALMAAGLALPDDVAGGLDDSLLIAGGGYARVLEDWRAEPSPVPTLLVRGAPTEQMHGIEDWLPHWPLPHDTADVPGDHYSLAHHDADTTAAAIRTWLENGDTE